MKLCLQCKRDNQVWMTTNIVDTGADMESIAKSLEELVRLMYGWSESSVLGPGLVWRVGIMGPGGRVQAMKTGLGALFPPSVGGGPAATSRPS